MLIDGLAQWVPEDDEQVEEQTVGALLRWAAAQAPDEVALVAGTPDPAGRRRWTFGQLLAESEQAARALARRFGPGERVAVWAGNIPEWVVLEFGAALAGLTLVTVNPALRLSEARHVLSDSQAAGLFLVREYREVSLERLAANVRLEAPGLREIVFFDQWDEFLAGGAPGVTLPEVRPGDPAQIQYTSGTTGPPKGAMLSHRGIVNNARLSYGRLLGMGRGDAFVNPMPLFHTAGCVLATLGPMTVLAAQVLVPQFDPALVLELVEAEHSFVFGGVPTMLVALLGHPDFDPARLTSVRIALAGGASVPPELIRRVEAALGVPFSVIFAQTEASPGITMTRADDSAEDRATTVGRPLPRTEVKIVGPGTGQTVAPGETGELCTRGYHVMLGYLGDVGQAVDADGWLHTGDLATMDDRGYSRIVGRLKEMIIRGGENIYPWEIEQVLTAHPDVIEAAVVGVPDPYWGEQVAAVVRLREPAEGAVPQGDLAEGGVTDDDLAAFCRDRLARHKVPKIWLRTDALPLTGSGKVMKHVLRDQLARDLRS
ncbi:MAG TPA: AMP-binding protein [Streptosporangiaceae bacterium]|jgi:fatty-acyl-CoA synthase